MIPSSWHGVTTVVVGNCGVGFAPVHPADHDRLIELMEGVEDIPGVVLHEGLPWNWQSFPEFIDAIDGRPYDIDVALQVPHGALRLHVMGERGAAREAATPDDIAAMARPGRRGGEAGALGFTTSAHAQPPHQPGRAHPDPHRRGRRAGRHRHRHRRHRPGRAPGGLRLRRRRRRVRHLPAHGRGVGPAAVVLAAADPGGDGWRRQLELLSEANAEGVPIRPGGARAVGLLLGLQCTLHPFLDQPGLYREIADLPLDRAGGGAGRPRRSGSGCSRRRGQRTRDGAAAAARRFDRMYELGDPPDYEPDPRPASRPAGPSATGATRSSSPTTCCSPTAAGRSSTCRSSTTPTATSTPPARCSPTPTPCPAWATAAPTSARSATPASPPRCWPTGAATATAAGWTCRSWSTSTPATARTVGLLDRGVLAPATGPTSTSSTSTPSWPAARDAPRPAGRRQAPGPAGRGLRRHRRGRPGHLRERRGHRPAARPPRPRPPARPRRRRTR